MTSQKSQSKYQNHSPSKDNTNSDRLNHDADGEGNLDEICVYYNSNIAKEHCGQKKCDGGRTFKYFCWTKRI